LGYSSDDVIALFGGNMGVPQKLENMIKLAQNASHLSNAKFLFIGSGTETERIKTIAVTLALNNIKFINQLSREDYEIISSVCDLGLVSLDERFTIPNFPSKTADYFKLQLPILASLDSCAAQDYGYFLTNIARAGRFALAGDSGELFNRYMELYSDSGLRKELGFNGRKFYEDKLDVNIACRRICEQIDLIRT
jgi:glycosyltransferase involved in cell wall biosynthesis